MIDRQHAKLTVAEIIREEPDTIIHVMEPCPDLRPYGRKLLLNDGSPCEWEIRHTIKNGHDDGMYQYGYEFVDQSVILPVGTVLTLAPEEWRKEIPGSELQKIVFTLIAGEIKPEVTEGSLYDTIETVHLTAETGGTVSIDRYRKYAEPQVKKYTVKLPPAEIEAYFSKMLRCVSGPDAYEAFWSDDTGRGVKFCFRDGTVLEYGIICCEEGNLVEMTEDLIRSCGDRRMLEDFGDKNFFL